MLLYDKYLSEKKRYEDLPQITIKYDEENKSIFYFSADESVAVNYKDDMTIKEVWYKESIDSDWKSLSYEFENILDSSYLLEKAVGCVVPKHRSSFEKEGMFDVMLRIIYDYEKENNIDKPMYISLTGFGCSHTPKLTFQESSGQFRFDPDVFYTKQYYILNDENNKERTVKESLEQDYEASFYRPHRKAR